MNSNNRTWVQFTPNRGASTTVTYGGLLHPLSSSTPLTKQPFVFSEPSTNILQPARPVSFAIKPSHTHTTEPNWCLGLPSVQFSCSLVSDSLRSHGSPHARPPFSSPTPGVYSNSSPLSRWCHPSHPLLSPSPPAFNLSQHQGFFNESALHIRWTRYWSFSFPISPSNEQSGLISFRMDWLDFLAVQGTLKNLFQHHNSKASIHQHSAFLIVQLSHLYMTTGKTIALTRRTIVGKGMSLLFNMLSRLVLTFLPRSKRLLISWLQSSSAVILEFPK